MSRASTSNLALISSQGAAFYWWDDAIAYARKAATRTGRRQQVRRLYGRKWVVREVGS